ncbi:hypothetical protein D3C81_1981760 [compost metagenome]
MRLGRVVNLGKALADFIEHFAGRFDIGVRHDDGELLAAVSANEIGLAQALLEKQRQALDHPVTHGVTVAVVDPLEVIDIEHREAQWLLFAACAE